MPTALLREVAETFDRAIVSEASRSPEVALARDQHKHYADALSEAGYEVVILPTDNDHPDCVFIEDTAVVLGKLAVITRPGAEARRGEVTAVEWHLSALMPVAHIEAPGTLDGGDAMVMGDRIYVGRSSRTNDDGISQLTDIARAQGRAVTTVPVSGVLHLKSAVLPVDEETVVVTPGAVDESLLSGLQVIHEVEGERHQFSALPLATGEVLVTDSAPSTVEKLVHLGMSLIPLDVSEIQAADGGLTCMSILIDS